MLLSVLLVLSLLCKGAPESISDESEEKRPDVKFILTDLSKRNQNLTWNTLIDFATGGLGDMLNKALPQIVKATSEVEIDTDCTAAFFQFYLGLKKLTPWALRMADASGKPPDGLIDGTLTFLGSYDECISTMVWKEGEAEGDEELQFTGSYCSLQLAPNFDVLETFHNKTHAIETLTPYLNSEKETFRIPGTHVAYRIGVCVPSACSKSDLNKLLQHVLKDLDVQGKVTRCEVREEVPFTDLQIAIVAVLVVLVIFVVLGTIMEESCAVDQISDDPKAALEGTDTVLVRFVRCFSLQLNLSDLFGTREPRSSNLAVLDGIRSISMLWVMFGHTYFFVENIQPFRSILNGHEMLTGNILLAGILNFTLSVDSFFLLSGLLIMYSQWRELEQTDRMRIIPFFLNKYWRMLPGLLVTMGLLFLMPHFGDGPFWKDIMANEIQICEERWWSNIVFANNVFDNQNMCLVATWYLACAFQLVLISPLLVIPLYRSFNRGIGVNLMFILGGSLITAALTFFYSLPPGMIFFPDLNLLVEICSKLYQKPYNHVGPFSIGILLGYFIRKHRNIRISKLLQLFFWIATIVSCSLVLFAAYPWNNELPSLPISTLYAATHRVIWSLGIAWLIFACVSGRGGFVGRILSWSGFGVLGRLAYLTYLIHPLLILFKVATTRVLIYYSHYEKLYSFCGHLVITLTFASVFYVLVEGPCSRIAGEFFKNRKPQEIMEYQPEQFTMRTSCKL